MATSQTIRLLDKDDTGRLTQFLQTEILIHRHLDWRPPVEWLGYQPYLALEEHNEIQAVLAMPDDPPGIFWIRLFACKIKKQPLGYWQSLFKSALQKIPSDPSKTLAALAYQDWFRELITSTGWSENQRVVLMKWSGSHIQSEELESQYLLRPLVNTDLDAVVTIDQHSFNPLWQQSLEATRQAYIQSAYATVVEFAGEVIAYQISTSSAANAHLARLAVLPQFRGRKVGSMLVTDMLQHFQQTWIRDITVNTQQDNQASRKLYKSHGFELTGESYPIYIYQPHIG
jgi:ribosomal protein S18 acetylase RimI-like enzyme